MQRTVRLVVSAFAALTFASTSQAAFIAYSNAAVTANQNYGGSLGLDFTVNSPILVTALGVFFGSTSLTATGHDGQTGISVAIFSTSTGLQIGPSITFGQGASAGFKLDGDSGDIFARLSTPLLLTNGSYSVVASNDVNYNSFGASNTTSTENSGGGLISFTGGGRYTASQGPDLVFPTILDSGPNNRYDAGTFQFVSAAAVPEPGTVVLLGMGALGLALSRRRRA